jgi:hypothetical protein
MHRDSNDQRTLSYTVAPPTSVTVGFSPLVVTYTIRRCRL